MTDRMICLAIGYFAGCFLTAYFIVKRFRREDVFRIGSGNPGMANVMAELGFGFGLAVLVGDLLKCFLAFALGWTIVQDTSHGTEIHIVAAWSGLGCILGHNFPFWHHFRGGKGVACTCAALFCIHPLWGILAMVAGMLVVFATKYLSIGAVLIPAVFVPIAYCVYGIETAVIVTAYTLLMLTRHSKDLRRIISGEEKKVDVIQKIRER